MTPKEKAVDIVNNYMSGINLPSPLFGLMLNEAKQCAIICVDEILNNFGLTCDGQVHYCSYSTISYYREVKQEIELL